MERVRKRMESRISLARYYAAKRLYVLKMNFSVGVSMYRANVTSYW